MIPFGENSFLSYIMDTAVSQEPAGGRHICAPNNRAIQRPSAVNITAQIARMKIITPHLALLLTG